MSHVYHGPNRMQKIRPENDLEVLIEILTLPEHINFILRLLESHCHVAVPVQLNPSKGHLGFHTTKDCLPELINILHAIPRPLEIINYQDI